MAGPYDVVVIGGGPGGYNAAIRCGQLGLKTAIVEMRPSSDGKGVALGGTCLNVGCIPSKALLHASQRFEEARDHFAPLGIKASVSLDLPGMLQHKTRTVATLVQGVAFLMKKNKAEVFFGRGRIGGPGKVIVAREGGEDTLETKHIIIATGSEVMPLPGVQVDERRIVSSTGALSLSSVPKTMIVIGGGYIGLEMGSVWRRLGASVTVVEYLDRITPGLDSEVSKEFQKILTRQGISFKLGTKVTSAAANETGVTLTVEPAKGGAAETLSAEVVLVSIGRRPFTAGLGLEAAGVTLDSKGRIVTDGHYRTSVPGIWAVGDVIDGPMLAHKAEDEAMAVAELIAGKPGHVNYETIPAVVYTAPEVASCGKTEDELKAAGVAYKAGKFPFTANARAKTIAEKDGFVKILADAATDRVLGCHIIGPEAGNMIMEVALGMEFGASSEDIARTCHAHPTLPEAVRQAALAIDGRTTQI